MKACKNCIHKSESKEGGICRKCHSKSKWEHDGLPSKCDGCCFFGKYQADQRHCYHCVDGSNKMSQEMFEVRKRQRIESRRTRRRINGRNIQK